jgi:hypothetical protein
VDLQAVQYALQVAILQVQGPLPVHYVVQGLHQVPWALPLHQHVYPVLLMSIPLLERHFVATRLLPVQ